MDVVEKTHAKNRFYILINDRRIEAFSRPAFQVQTNAVVFNSTLPLMRISFSVTFCRFGSSAENVPTAKNDKNRKQTIAAFRAVLKNSIKACKTGTLKCQKISKCLAKTDTFVKPKLHYWIAVRWPSFSSACRPILSAN